MVLKEKSKKSLIEVEDFGFILGLVINVDSCMGGDGSDVINFLLLEIVEEVCVYYEKFCNCNDCRKEIDMNM